MSGKSKRRSTGFKAMALSLAFVLVIGASVAGTLAWLTAETETVTNTFVSAKLFGEDGSFTLWEHQAKDDDADGRYTLNEEEVSSNTYKILPGVDIPKDPTVDVVNLEEHAYMYIKVTGLPMQEGLSATVDITNWEKLAGYSDIYVYIGSHADNNNIIKATNEVKKTFTVTILTGNQIEVADTYSGTGGEIQLSFDAYMVQATGNGDSAAAAWANTYGKTTP